MKTLKDFKVTNCSDGWKCYDIIGLHKDDVNILLTELKKNYLLVVPCIGRFIDTYEYYGNVHCKTLIQSEVENA